MKFLKRLIGIISINNVTKTKMKTKTLFYMALMAVMTTLAACSQDDEPLDAAQKPTAIEFEITDGGFAGEQTRAVEEGYCTKFTKNDECGLYIVNGSTLKATNVKLTASEENGKITWKPENTTDISGAAEGDKYFLYYPYQDNMTNKIDVTNTSEDDKFFKNLIDNWQVETDQSDYKNYTASDLMTAEGTLTTGTDNTQTITFKLTHRMALAEIVAPVEVNFSSTYYTPYKAEEWKYRLIVNPGKVGSKTIKGTVGSKTFTISSNKLKNLTPEQYRTFKVGTSYYVDTDGLYHVYNADGLIAWGKKANVYPYSASCILEADITMPTDGENATNNWTPVCQNNSNGFTGTFDGNGKSISGLSFNLNANSAYLGFIGKLGKSGTVKNLTLKGANMSSTGTNCTIGAVAGSNGEDGTISNCHVTNSTISGKYHAGGVTGYNMGTISYCHVAADCSVKVESESAQSLGGIAGYNTSNKALITACYTLCSLSATGSAKVGGICGDYNVSVNYVRCTSCYSRCKLLNNPSGDAGCIFGKLSGTINACYWANAPEATIEFTKGIGNGTDTTFKVSGATRITWTDAAEKMNTALGAGSEYQYKVYSSSQTEPLILVKKQ